MNSQPALLFDTVSIGSMGSAAGIMQASNGWIYGLSSHGTPSIDDEYPLFAYDPVTDSVKIVVRLNTLQYQWGSIPFGSSLVEYSSGVLVGNTGNGSTQSSIFKYYIANDSIALVTLVPAVSYQGSTIYPVVEGTLFMATDERLYGGESPWPQSLGRVARINVQSNNLSATQLLDVYQGWPLNSGMQQVGDMIYTTTNKGGNAAVPLFDGWGTIGAYDLSTNTYQKKIDLDSTVHNPFRGMVQHTSGVFYGEALGVDQVLIGGGVMQLGCIYSYTATTNSLVRVVNYVEIGYDITGIPLQPGLLAASNGKIYGSFQKGIFEYDPVADTLLLRAPLQYNSEGQTWSHGLQSPLIEICRKPNYKPRLTTAFSVCNGSYFFYDLQNVNATHVVWRRNGGVMPTHTDQRLEFSSITAADAGVWTCTLTNECGTTEPPAITITVQPGTFTASTIGGDTLLCGYGDSATLTGNNGGTWNTGATTPTLIVTQPGSYYVTNQQGCGLSMGNSLHVAHADSAVAPTIQGGTAWLCFGDSLLLEGNSAGPWNNIATGIWSTGDTSETIFTQGEGEYYVVHANVCNSDTSDQRYIIFEYGQAAAVVVTYTDAFGQPADNLLCTGDSVLMQLVPQQFPPFGLGPQYAWYSGGNYVAEQNNGTLWVNAAATYEVRAFWCNTETVVATVNVAMHEQAPQVDPVILPDQIVLAGCDQDTVFISTDFPNVFWTWTDANGTQQVDSNTTMLIDWAASGYLLTAFNGCGNGPQDYIQVLGTPTPDVLYSEPNSVACINDVSFALAPGFPTGGTYSGAGISGNTFDPALAGLGTHAITYSYGSGNCMGQATANITVDLCTGIEEAGSEREISILPNPNSGRFTIQISKAFNHGEATLFDAKGTRVGAAHKLVVGSNVLEPTGLATGVYQVRIELDGAVVYRSLVVVGE